MNDLQLVIAIKNGKTECFEELHKKYKGKIAESSYNLLSKFNSIDKGYYIEEFEREAILQMYATIAYIDVDKIRDKEAYLFAFDFRYKLWDLQAAFRKQIFETFAETSIDDSSYVEEEISDDHIVNFADTEDLNRKTEKFWDSLSPNQARAVKLRGEGLTFLQIADIFDKPYATVHGYVREAKFKASNVFGRQYNIT
ncbi:MAG: hypothetical protein GY793_10720, partial [Proteobacteria bacterium]|nr:hypothetical protein [Pseudomonadota bacterium]